MSNQLKLPREQQRHGGSVEAVTDVTDTYYYQKALNGNVCFILMKSSPQEAFHLITKHMYQLQSKLLLPLEAVHKLHTCSVEISLSR